MGSSKKRISGLCIRLLTISNLRLMPPDMSLTCLFKSVAVNPMTSVRDLTWIL